MIQDELSPLTEAISAVRLEASSYFKSVLICSEIKLDFDFFKSKVYNKFETKLLKQSNLSN